MKTSVVTQEKEHNEQHSNNLKEFLAPIFNNMSNGEQKKIGKSLKRVLKHLEYLLKMRIMKRITIR